MGIDSNHARFLLSAHKRGVVFRRSVMIGRQYCVLDRAELTALLSEFGYTSDADVSQACQAYAEPLLKFLGAEDVASIDVSPYQGATLLHDMNKPIPDSLKGRFDVVLEGGSLEHIFNFPTAVKNCMEMVAEGGHYLGIGPANNFCGHGFYQFSPDLFFRVFSGENGFTVERAILCEAEPDSEWIESQDPLTQRQYIDCAGYSRPTYILIQARKIESRPIFEKYPEQSVYTFLWKGEYPGNDRDKLFAPTSRV